MDRSEAAEDLEKTFSALKCVLLTSGSSDLNSVLRKFGLPLAINCDSLDWSNQSWFKLASEDSDIAPISPLPFREFDSLASFCDNAGKENEYDYLCLLISPQPQYAVHDPLLINSSGVYIVCCGSNEGEELTYLTRVLDRIVACTPSDSNSPSVVFVKGIGLDRIPSKYNMRGKINLVHLHEDSPFLSIFKDNIWHCEETLVLSNQSFRFLKKSNSVVLYKDCKGEVDVKTLEDLHRMGIIFFHQQQELDRSLVFTQPKLLHKLLTCVDELMSSGSTVQCMVANVCNLIASKDEYKFIRKIKKNICAPFVDLLLSLQLAVETPHGHILVHSTKKMQNLHEIHSSVAPLLVKLKEITNVSVGFFFEFATLLHNDDESKGTYLTMSEDYNLNCITFTGHCYRVYMCRRDDAILEFRYQCIASGSNFSCEAWNESFKNCSDVLKAVECKLQSLEKKFTCGFVCSAKHNCNRFAEYRCGKSLLSCSGQAIQELACHQRIWFDCDTQLDISEKPVEEGTLLIVNPSIACPEGKVTTNRDCSSLPGASRYFCADEFMEKYPGFPKDVVAKKIYFRLKDNHVIGEDVAHKIEITYEGEAGEILYNHLKRRATTKCIRTLCKVMIEVGVDGCSRMKSLGEIMSKDKDLDLPEKPIGSL